jgi:hypothetical protein
MMNSAQEHRNVLASRGSHNRSPWLPFYILDSLMIRAMRDA